MNSTVIITAVSKRYFSRYFQDRNIVDIMDEPLVVRTQRQARDRGGYPIVITDYDKVRELSKCCIYIEKSPLWLTTVLASKPLWKDRIIILLGDVVYSKETMDRIFAFEGDIGVFANSSEVFAIIFNKGNERVEHAFEELKKIGREKRDHAGPWNFYRAICGYDLIKHKVDAKDYIFQSVLDWTTDMDYKREYDKFYNAIIKTRKIDDLMPMEL